MNRRREILVTDKFHVGKDGNRPQKAGEFFFFELFEFWKMERTFPYMLSSLSAFYFDTQNDGTGNCKIQRAP